MQSRLSKRGVHSASAVGSYERDTLKCGLDIARVQYAVTFQRPQLPGLFIIETPFQRMLETTKSVKKLTHSCGESQWLPETFADVCIK